MGWAADNRCRWATIAVAVFVGTSLARQDRPDAVREALDSAARLLSESRPREALESLRPVAEAEPDNPWLWFYRGAARQQLGDPRAAIRCFDRAQAILAELGGPDTQLADRIDEQRLRARREIFSASLSAGLAYDTNVAYLGSGSGRTDMVSGRADGRFGSQFRVDYAPIIACADTVAVGARLAQSWNFSVESYDQQGYGGYVRYGRRLGHGSEIGLQYDYDLTLLGGEPFLSTHILTPQVAYTWTTTAAAVRPTLSRAYYLFEADDLLRRSDRHYDLDGLANGAGLEQGFRVASAAGGQWAFDLLVGYRFAKVATSGTQFDRASHVFHWGVIVPLPPVLLPRRDLTLRFANEWAMDRYRRANLIDRDGDRRRDLLGGYILALSQKIIRDDRRGDLTLHAIVQWLDADSNVTGRYAARPFTYDKAVYGVHLEWSW